MDFFSIEKIAFTIWGSPVSYLELFGFISGGIAVWLSARTSLLSWPIGIVNVALTFFLFYQSQLYPDMFLQIFYLVTNIVGWWRWAKPKTGEENIQKELRVSRMTRDQIIACSSIAVVGTITLGLMATRLHEWFPAAFKLPSAAPFQDSFIMVTSILAQYYMMHKKIECWIAWLVVDILATFVYFNQQIYLYSLLYFIFCGLAIYALWNWTREYRSYTVSV